MGSRTCLRSMWISALLMLVSANLFAAESRRDHFSLYGGGSAEERARICSLIAVRGDFGVSGDYKDYNILRKINPNFGWMLYISVQDSYTSGAPTDLREHQFCSTMAVSEGVNPEINYVHYWDATELNWTSGGVTRTYTYPGLANARTRADSVASRMQVYIPNGYTNRIMKNYSSPLSRKYHVAYAMTRLKELPPNSQVGYYSGIAWDNSGYRIYSTYGNIVRGGHIAEAPKPGGAIPYWRVDSIGTASPGWYWDQLKLFLRDIMDTLETSPQWHPDGQMKSSTINTANSWIPNDGFVEMPRVATYLSTEYQYNSIRNTMADFEEAYRRDTLARKLGFGMHYNALTQGSPGGSALGSYTYRESMHNNLCWFYAFSTDSSSLSIMRTDFNTNGLIPGWDTAVWCGSFDYDMGHVSLADKMYTVAGQGTDPSGYPYKVYSRNYPRGKVFIRPRGRSTENIDDATTVSVNLGGSYREIRPDGSLGSTVTSATFRNGQGRLFAPATGTGDGTPPSPVQDLSAIAGPTNGTIALEWTAPGDDNNTGTASAYSIKYSTLPLTEASWNSAPSYGNPPAPQAGGSAEQLVLTGLGVGQRYYLGVRAIDDQGNMGGLSNEAISFSKGIAAPTLDTVLVLKTTREVVLKTDPVSSYYQIRVEFQLDTDNTFASAQTFVDDTPTGSPQVTIPDLVDNQLYYWRARSVSTDDSNASNWSITGSFRPSFTIVTGDDETKVIVVGGTDLVSFSSPRPTLSVQNLLFGSSNQYFFEVATDDNFDAIIASSSAIPEADNGVTSWQVPDKLSSGITYYWHARANDYPYSNTATFVVDLQAHPFPNPVNLNSGTPVTFTNLPSGKNLVIMTVSGEVVRRWTDLSGADLTWDGKNESGSKIAAGTYLWFIEDSEMKGKLIVIR